MLTQMPHLGRHDTISRAKEPELSIKATSSWQYSPDSIFMQQFSSTSSGTYNITYTIVTSRRISVSCQQRGSVHACVLHLTLAPAPEAHLLNDSHASPFLRIPFPIVTCIVAVCGQSLVIFFALSFFFFSHLYYFVIFTYSLYICSIFTH